MVGDCIGNCVDVVLHFPRLSHSLHGDKQYEGEGSWTRVLKGAGRQCRRVRNGSSLGSQAGDNYIVHFCLIQLLDTASFVEVRMRSESSAYPTYCSFNCRDISEV